MSHIYPCFTDALRFLTGDEGAAVCHLLDGSVLAGIAMLTRHIDMPVLLSKSMFHIGSAWLVFTLYMIFALLIADVTKLFVPSLNHGFYYALGVTCCLLIQRIIFVRTSFQNRDE